MDRRRFLGATGAAIVGASTVPGLLAASPSRPLAVYIERWSWAMGQPVSLKLFAVCEDQGYAAAQAAFAELRRVEGVLSRFDPRSDLTALNERAGRGSVRVADDLRAALLTAEWVRRESGGAFDPAIEPVMRAWGFHEERRTAPTEGELAEARDAVRAARVRVTDDAVELGGSRSALDLGGIGVGLGLDRAGAVLRRAGITSALLDVSGDCLAIGAPPGESGWAVGIADPRNVGGDPVRTLRLRDQALATSANTVATRRWRELIVGHVMDPRTARSAGRVRQVTVVAPNGILADAWSTARLVSAGSLPPGCRAIVV